MNRDIDRTQTTEKPILTDPTHMAIVGYLKACRRDGALWTSDVAYGVGLTTGLTRRELAKLDKVGTARRVVIGNPTSWELVSYD